MLQFLVILDLFCLLMAGEAPGQEAAYSELEDSVDTVEVADSIEYGAEQTSKNYRTSISYDEPYTEDGPIDGLIRQEVLLDYNVITVPPSCMRYTRPSASQRTVKETTRAKTAPPSTCEEPQPFSNENLPNPGDIPLLNRKMYKANTVSIQEHPYVVSIRRNYSHYLTGSLVSNNMVVTVAHPVYMVPIHQLCVVTGETYSDRGQRLEVVIFVLIHPKFDQNTLSHDLALLRLYSDVIISPNCKPVVIKGAPRSGLGFVTGWGRCDGMGKTYCLPRGSSYYPGERQDPVLKRIKIPRARFHQCLSYRLRGVKVNHKSLCAGAPRAEVPGAPCLGVPGAPLVVNTSLVGILSHGQGCGYSSDLPLVYVDVVKHYIWLRRVISKMSGLSAPAVFRSFYIGTKAYAAALALAAQRPSLPARRLHGRDIVPVVADGFLMKLEAAVYDIRDFINDGAYHESKQELYNRFRTLDYDLMPNAEDFVSEEYSYDEEYVPSGFGADAPGPGIQIKKIGYGAPPACPMRNQSNAH